MRSTKSCFMNMRKFQHNADTYSFKISFELHNNVILINIEALETRIWYLHIIRTRSNTPLQR